MRMRTVLIGVCALVFGVCAAVGVYLLGTSAPVATKAETVSVVVANVDINRGQTLTAELLTTRDWPKDMVPEGVITGTDKVLERTVAIPLIKGDLLLEAKLATKGSGRGMAAIIPSGMRAVTIQTPNVATGVAGFILPGNKVDVLLTMNNQGAADLTGGGSTITLLQNIEILAVDQQTDVPQENKVDTKELRSVTLLVTPAQAARIDLGQNKGTLRLTLRNPTDKATEFVDAVTLSGLTMNPSEIAAELQKASSPVVTKAEAVPTAPTKRFIPMIRTLRGTRSGIIQLSNPNDDPAHAAAVPARPLVSTVPDTPRLSWVQCCHRTPTGIPINTIGKRIVSPTSLENRRSPTFSRTLAYDLGEMAIVLLLYLGLVGRLMMPVDGRWQLANLLLLPSEGLVLIFLLFRRRTDQISLRWRDWLLALSATVAPMLVQPGGDAPLVWPVLGAILLLIGLIIQVHAKLALGRSFGCVPANRGLKLTGPYRFVRHPMYAGYLLGHVAFLLMNPTLRNVIVYAVCYSLQIPRLLNEERLLANDPQYRIYQCNVKYWLIPGVV